MKQQNGALDRAQRPKRARSHRAPTRSRPKRFHPLILRRIKQAADIRVILARYDVALRGNRGPCVICETSLRSSAFSITPNARGWKCHACCEHGDAIRLVQLAEHVSFPEAVGIVGEMFAVPLDVEIDDAIRRQVDGETAARRAERDARWQRRERLRVRTIELTDLRRWVSLEITAEVRALVDDAARDESRLHMLVTDEQRVERELDRTEAELREIEQYVSPTERLANVARILGRAVELCHRAMGGGRGRA